MLDFIYRASVVVCGTAGALVFAGRLFTDPTVALGFVAIVVSVLLFLSEIGGKL